MDEFWRQMIVSIKNMGSPMRPEPREISFIEGNVEKWVSDVNGQSNLKALLLGVTPEIVNMNWPIGIELEAVDRSEAMAEAFWLGDIPGKRKLTQGNWWDFPAAANSFHFIFGDGIFNIQEFPGQFKTFASRMSALLHLDGLAFFRVFTRSENPASPEEVISQLRSGHISSYQDFKLSFTIALQEDASVGYASSIPNVHQALKEMGVSAEELALLRGYSGIAEPMLALSKPQSLQMCFPSQQEFIEAVSPWFHVVEVGYGGHLLAHHCPVFCLAQASH